MHKGSREQKNEKKYLKKFPVHSQNAVSCNAIDDDDHEDSCACEKSLRWFAEITIYKYLC